MSRLQRRTCSNAVRQLLQQAYDCCGRVATQQGAQASSAVLPAAAAGPCEGVASRIAQQQHSQQQQWLQPRVLQLFQQLRQPGPIRHSSHGFASAATHCPPVSKGRHALQRKVRQVVTKHVRISGPPLQTSCGTARAARPQQGGHRQRGSAQRRKQAVPHSINSTSSSGSHEQLLVRSWGLGQRFVTVLRNARNSGQTTGAQGHLQAATQILLSDLEAAPPAAITWLLTAYRANGGQPQQQQLTQLLQHVSNRAADCSFGELSAVVHGAKLAGLDQQQQQQLLLPLLQHVRLPATADAAAVRTMLLAHSLAEQQVPAQQQELLLQRLAGSAETLSSVHDIAEFLYWAKHTGCNLSSSNCKQYVLRLLDRAYSLVLQAPNTATSEDAKALLQLYEVAGVPVPNQRLQDLIRARLPLLGGGRQGRTEILRVLRSVAWSRVPLQESVLQALVQPLLQEPTIQAATLIKVLKGISYSSQPVDETLLASIVDRILWQQAQQQSSDPLTAAAQSAAILKAANCLALSLPQSQLQQLLQPLLHQALELRNIEFVPPILINLAKMKTMRLPLHQLLPLIAQAVTALEQAAATWVQQPTPWQKQRSSSSSINSSDMPDTNSLSATLIVELAQAIGHQQSRLPRELAKLPIRDQVAAKIYLSADLVQPLTDSFLAQQPPLPDIANYLAALCNMQCSSLSPNMDLVLLKGSINPGQLLQVQQQLQQQQVALLARPETGNFLWAIVSMGYCLPHQLILQLGQQLLCTLQPSLGFSVTQAIWALTGALHSEADAATEDLIQSLIRRQLQESRSGQRQHSRDFWQLSLSAWAAAVCDARSCKDIVLELCRELARPAAWGTLRESEHVQLTFTHLWLCNYQWSDNRGLAQCFSADQMQALLQTRQKQVKTCAADAMINFQRVFSQDALSRAAKITRQRRDLPSWQEITHFPAGADISNLQLQDLDQVAPTIKYSQGVLFVAVSQLPFIKSASLEQVTDDGLFSIDVAAETHDGVRLAIEFDGPYHYAVQVIGEATAASGAVMPRRNSTRKTATSKTQGSTDPHVHTMGSVVVRDVRTRSTYVRDKALSARGYLVVPVYFRNWPTFGSHEQQKQYVYDLITAALNSRDAV